MSNQRYPEEFKIEAAKRVTERGLPVGNWCTANGSMAAQTQARSNDPLRPRQSIQQHRLAQFSES